VIKIKQFGHGIVRGFPLFIPLLKMKKCGFPFNKFWLLVLMVYIVWAIKFSFASRTHTPKEKKKKTEKKRKKESVLKRRGWLTVQGFLKKNTAGTRMIFF
jgi:hypothetical protein